MTSTTTTKPSTKKPRRMAREPQEKVEVAQSPGVLPSQAADAPLSGGDAAKPATKSAIVIGLLTRNEGATLEAMVAATGWLPHTTRAALTSLKKKGITISSEKMDGVRTYRAALPDRPVEGEAGEVAAS
jgi:hypothetical protein